ncbi:hypothetical protein OHA25_12515 [Nonomuraea sp. NBC_00507]|uniref:hypothetical protein n=1 Tax=Nonomuraea sp. NBC_00507 TaxID=2976002 RepID=UPI002E18EC47
MTTFEDLPPGSREYAETVLPVSLCDLRGPARGILSLPRRVAWSGRTDYDLSVYEQRLEAYARVLEAGTRDDIIGLLNHTLLIGHWFDLWWRLDPIYRAVWEITFPELGAISELAEIRRIPGLMAS